MVDLSLLNVSLYDERIGTLALLPGDQTLFSFDQGYIDNPRRPKLGLLFQDAYGELITEVKPTRTRVPPFFSNLLPEGSLRDYLARKAGVNAKREFFLLWVLGRDLPGAVTITPADDEPWPPETGGKYSDEQIEQNAALHFSLAGVQLKFSAVMEANGGLTIPAQGIGGSWIAKLPSTTFEAVPENEYAMMTLARQVGLDVPEVRLVPVKDIAGLPEEMGRMGGNALAVKRFDRTDEGRIHIEDFAQVFGIYPEKKYERISYRNIAEVLWAETGEEGIAELIRRLVYNAMIGNADMHLKNWSLVYPDKRTARLSPGYDFVSTICYLDDTKMALKLGRSKEMRELSLDQLSYLAAKARLPEKLVLDAGRETVERFMDIWQGGQAIRDISPIATGPIEDLLARIPLLSEVAMTK